MASTLDAYINEKYFIMLIINRWKEPLLFMPKKLANKNIINIVLIQEYLHK